MMDNQLIKSDPQTDISELENQPPLSPTNHWQRQPANRIVCPMKVKQEKVDDSSSQSQDQCDNNNLNSNKSVNSNYVNKTTIAKQLLTVIRNNDFDELLIILRSKPDLNVFLNGQTALHYCLMFGRDVSWCRQLVSSGANPNLSNHDGWQPLHLAAFNGLQESLTYLITCNKNNKNNEIL